MTITSNWKLTIRPASSPIVLVNYDDELLEEPEFSQVIGMNVVRIPYGSPRFELTSADYYEFTIAKVFYAATDAAARQAMMEAHTDTYATLGEQPVRLQVRDLTDRRYDWAGAVFSRPRTRRLLDYSTEGRAAWVLSHSVTARSFAKTVF